MTGYERQWDCLVCGRSQRSIDRPKVEVCDTCVGAENILLNQYPSLTDALRRVATRAYERGFEHGRRVQR
jgi:hypothetical protein